jgi:hypothetical protein
MKHRGNEKINKISPLRKQKIRFKGTFNLKHEMHRMYCHAYTERQAWLTFCRRIAEKKDVRYGVITGYFDGSKDNFQITREEKCTIKQPSHGSEL